MKILILTILFFLTSCMYDAEPYNPKKNPCTVKQLIWEDGKYVTYVKPCSDTTDNIGVRQ